MPNLRLTDTWLKARQTPGEYADAIGSHLKVRVSAKGRKTFSVVKKIDGKVARTRIGNYPEVGLGEARRTADAIFHASGPVLNAPEPAVALGGAAPTLATFLGDYIEDMRARGLKSAAQVENSLVTGRYAFLPFMVKRYGAMPKASDITIRDMQAWMAESYARAPGFAVHLRSYLVSSWKWAVANRFDYRGRAKDYGIEFNIASQLPTVQKSKPGDRFLSKDELRTLWHALDAHLPTHRVLKLMIAMGGLRVTEVTMSLAANWEGEWLRLPETKNGRSHALPVTRVAAPIVEEALAFTHPRSKYLFSHPRDPETPMTTAAISRAAKRLNKQLGFPNWNPRDIRRTMKTHLADAGVDERWLDIWHNHGQTAGVARRHYIRAEYEDLKRDVAEQLDAFLLTVL
ncbi:MAG: site-specific integrase [Pseudomonadota bacterium]